MKLKNKNPLVWIFEPLQARADFLQKKMFGCEAAYFQDRLMLVVAAKEEPWNGLMVCTDRERQADLCHEFPALVPHPVLGKWLYISQRNPDFEEYAVRIGELAKAKDSRIGVIGKPKKKRSTYSR